MDQQIVSIYYKGEEFTFRLKVNDQKVVRSWMTIKLIPAGETFVRSYKLLGGDHATFVWNKRADHFYSSNDRMMLDDELMEAFRAQICNLVSQPAGL